ncbi:DUF4255 domain-containing protein [Paenibacillus hamazuiensis]|uniref:DUF4255 domain-containing protein n=1 Tax=Paenibacillus hamazuiensis TaxID=2936508 RepID=UPI00200C9C5B|nr:DUF4255 domain-containing protein [Paenibacillus hamazuiensis]
MGDYTAIADVSQTLIGLLREQLTPYPIARPELVGLASPAEKGDFGLTLFLYSIKECIEYRQAAFSGQGGGSKPPMAVELNYLMTAHSAADPQTRALDEHLILGRAMQVFHENGIIDNSSLRGTLAENREAIRIVRESLPLDTMLSLFPQMPYKLSVSYLVGPVFIDSGKFSVKPRVRGSNTRMEGV